VFDEPREEPQYEDELEEKFRNVMANSAVARRGYDAAKSYGMNEEMRAKAAVIQLAELNNRAMAIIADAILHGMPITKEVAELRTQNAVS